MTMGIVTLRGDEVWLDGEHVATIAGGLSETMRDRVRAAFEGVKIETTHGYSNHLHFHRTERGA